MARGPGAVELWLIGWARLPREESVKVPVFRYNLSSNPE